MSDVKDRMKEFLEYLGLGQLAFENETGLSRGFVNKIGYNISKNSIEKIAKRYPDLNIAWLKSGAGEMLNTSGQIVIGDNNTTTQKNGNQNTTNYTTNNYVSSDGISQDIDDMSDRISLLEWDANPQNSNVVPLLPIAAQGGSLNDFVVSIKGSECEKVVSPVKGADFAMPVSGDSMAPEYPSGSQIFIKKVNERAFIDWGKVYVLDTCNGSVIKRIYPAEDKSKDKVKCVSINPEYPPFEVAFEDIFGIYRVLLCMSIK